MSEAEMAELVASRGYCKATITRLHNTLCDPEAKITLSPTELKTRRERVISSFAEYEAFNKKILRLKPDDSEDVEKVENKFFKILSVLDEKIDSTTSPPQTTAQISSIRLPVIQINTFSGKYSEYVPFIEMYRSLIHNDANIDAIQKLHYLRSYLKGEAFDLVKNLPLTKSSYYEAMDLLQSRYYNKYKIRNEHINMLLDIKPITNSSSTQIREFVSTVRQTLAALKNLGANVTEWAPLLINIFNRKIDLQTPRAYQLERNADEDPGTEEFLQFLERRALASENAEPAMVRPSSKVAVHAATTEMKQGCRYCKSLHKIYLCDGFKLLPVSQRIKFIKENKLCSLCLNSHPGKCRFFFKCASCKSPKHHTLLHTDQESKQGPIVMFSGNDTTDDDDLEENVLLPTVRIKLFTRDGREVHVKAVLDSCSQKSLASQKLVDVLGITPKRNETNIIGVTNSKKTVKYSVPLEIHSLNSSFSRLLNCGVVDEVTCHLPQERIDRSKVNIPPDMTLADEEFHVPSEINMLIGANVFFQSLLRSPYPDEALSLPWPVEQHEPESGPSFSQRSQRKDKCLHIVNTEFGHIIGGDLPDQYEVTKIVSLLCTKCDTKIDKNLTRFWEAEAVPEIFKEHDLEHDIVEKEFQSTVKLENNVFQVNLPLKIPLSDVNKTLGASFDLALYRFLNLEKRLSKNSNLLTDYHNFIHEYVDLGHGSYFDFDSIDLDSDPVYFLPHHAVINENSTTTRTRVVFDASMRTKNKISLNDILLNGPIVQRDLFDIVLLYRFGDYTFSTDIRRMFRNVLVNPEYTLLQNILWRDNPNECIKCIRLNTVTYGLKCSSYLATRCLLELANRYEAQFPLASYLIKNCSYVDDVLYSESDKAKIVDAKRELIELLALGSFQTHKWSSNCEDVLHDVPQNKRLVDDIELQKECQNIKALGLTINAKDDCFVIKCPDTFSSESLTKRQMLSQIASFYDPMGFVSPIIVKAKVIMQRLWLEKVDWDARPSEELQQDWSRFASGLASMEPINIHRNIEVPKQAEAVQLIGFADASGSTGFGCCIYLRVVNPSGKAELSLLCSKSRINPRTKTLTIPRLELNANLLLAKLMTKVHDTIKSKIKIDSVCLFSDSQIALAWIQTEPTKLKAYVSNRVRVIQQLTNRWRWQYVNGNENPADYVSRGLDPKELSGCSMWWEGPGFLQNREYKFDNQTIQLPEDLPELQTSSTSSNGVVLLTTKGIDFFRHFDKYSDINKMTRVMAYILRFCHNSRPQNIKNKQSFLSSAELQRALMLIIRHEQEIYFEEEIKCLIKNENIKGPLKPLHIFRDELGLIRVGGRLQNSDLSFDQKHPIILPKSSRITELIIHREHLRLLHAGPRLILSQLNQKFWLVNGIRQIKKITHRCVTCFKLKGATATQLMGQYPKQRVTHSRAYQVIAIDYCGPIFLKNSRIRRAVTTKGYVCVFVCFATKAVHFELASDLSTDTFLACFKRFISRRAMPTDVYCDNGGAFQGANNALNELYKLNRSAAHQAQVHNYSSQQGIKFHFTPSYSPVFAGLAEAAVKSMKFHLKRTLEKSILTYEQLNTVICQIEAILNSRPLMPMSSSDISDFSYLTPGHFVTGVPLTSFPEPNIADMPLNRLTFWKVVESLKQSFWKSWHKQYLNALQSRPKWRDDLPNVVEGMLVILRDPTSPPLYWPMARIKNVFPGADGKVRALEVVTSNGKCYKRSITGICILPIN